MKIEVLQGDITTFEAEAIVTAANSFLRGGGSVDGAIHQAAGPELLEELKRFNGCETGDAVITNAYNLSMLSMQWVQYMKTGKVEKISYWLQPIKNLFS